MKTNPDWLSGGHLFVRTAYLRLAHDWPYPAPIARAFASLEVDRVLAWSALAAEYLLALVLWVRRPYVLAVALGVGIHVVGTFVTNVWFFSICMVASIAILMPRKSPQRGAEAADEGAADGAGA